MHKSFMLANSYHDRDQLKSTNGSQSNETIIAMAITWLTWPGVDELFGKQMRKSFYTIEWLS